MYGYIYDAMKVLEVIQVLENISSENIQEHRQNV